MRHWIFAGLMLAATMPASAADEAVTSTIDDQTRVEVTVYNNNLGLVKDVRAVKLPKGEGELRFMDVAAQIKPETVLVRSLTAAGGFGIIEQNYEFDLINRSKLLDKYVGRELKLLDYNREQDRKEIVTAELLSNNDGPVYRIDGEIFLSHPGIPILPQLPENLIAKPTLTWLVDAAQAGAQTLEATYLTNGLTWRADYVLAVNEDDTGGDISGWVTLTNNSGTEYRNADLKIVAGEVQRVQEFMSRGGFADMAMDARAPSAKGFVEQGFFEYHLYDLQRPTTIKDRQTKQISLLEAAGLAVEKELVTLGNSSYYYGQYHGQELKQPVNVMIAFMNEEENQMGMPLPAGIIRLYKEDNSGALQFIGENRVDHTPKDEEVELKVGEAFDVVAERKQLHYQRLSTRLHESEWEVTLRNHKEEDVVVSVVEPMQVNQWQIVQSSHPYEKDDAFTVRFDVPVPKDGEVKVKYRVRVGI